METVEVQVRVSRMLQFALICCPGCGLNCPCTGYLPDEMALFECRNCDRRYYVGLGPSPVLRVEALPARESAA